MSTRLDRVSTAATVLVALCAVVATLSLSRSQTVTPVEPTGDRPKPGTVDVPVANWRDYIDGGQSLGPTDAAVTIIEFGDYECPYCARATEAIKAILSAYPDDVRFVYRHWPLRNHRFAYPAARAAECAGMQGKFWEVHDLLYAKQDSLGLIPFEEFGRRAGLKDLSAYMSCSVSRDTMPAIETGPKHARMAGGTGTPTFIVNGMLLAGGVTRLDTAYVAKVLGQLNGPNRSP